MSQAFYLCPLCGAACLDTDKHIQWHVDLAAKLPVTPPVTA